MGILRLGGHRGLSGSDVMHIGAGGGLKIGGAQTYMQRVLSVAPGSLIGYWPLSDISGSVAADASGYSRNGVIVGGTLGIPGIGDGRTAVRLSGSGSVIKLGQAEISTAFYGQEWTISFWIKMTDVATWTQTAATINVMRLYSDASNVVNFYLYTDAALYLTYTSGGVVKSVTELNIGTKISSTENFINIVVHASKANDELVVWINGRQSLIATGVGTWVGNLSTTLANIGAFDGNGFRAIPASFAHVALWSGAGSPRAQAEINKIAYVQQPPTGGVAIMFDDAYASQYSIAYPILAAVGIKATTYIVSDWIGLGGRLTTANLATLDAAGWDVGNHTKDHTSLTTLSEPDQETELLTCKAYLDGLGLTRASAHVSYPTGLYNADTLTAMAATGMQSGRAVENSWPIDLRSAKTYELKAYTTNDTIPLATMQGWALSAKNSNQIAAIFFHNINGAAEVTTANFQSLVDYLVANNIPTYIITQIVPMIRPVW